MFTPCVFGPVLTVTPIGEKQRHFYQWFCVDPDNGKWEVGYEEGHDAGLLSDLRFERSDLMRGTYDVDLCFSVESMEKRLAKAGFVPGGRMSPPPRMRRLLLASAVAVIVLVVLLGRTGALLEALARAQG